MDGTTILRIASFLIYSFGAYAFGSILYYTLRDRSISCWRRAPDGGRAFVWESAAAYGLIAVSFLWFLNLLALQFARLTPGAGAPTLALEVLNVVLGLAFPGLIMGVTYSESTASAGIRLGAAWRLPIPVVLAMLAVVVSIALLAIFDVVPLSRRTTGNMLGLAFAAGFGTAAVYSVLVIRRVQRARQREAEAQPRRAESARERRGRRRIVALFALMLLMTAAMVLFEFQAPDFNSLLYLLATSLPLIFVFVGTYDDNRFEFVDLFVKRGATTFVTVLLLAGWFAGVAPLLAPLASDAVRPWAAAIALLPVALALPWLHARIGGFLDRRWLGRRYTGVGAVQRVLSGLRGATSEQELVRRAEAGLAEIFQAPARVDLSLREAPDAEFDCVQQVPLRQGGAAVGAVLLGRRANDVPYFSEDLVLAASLADVLSSLLENLRLHRRERELSLEAGRSELKALRAQVHPHFLFNALNAIAGLIHRDPERADRTVEQLAEVFRFTLRRSREEWARLEDELEFVRAYLDVEQARFGDRLTVRDDVDPAAGAVRVPTMTLQTLVENAIKHGVAARRGPATVEIAATVRDGRLRLEVCDNGPGPAGRDDPASDEGDGDGERFGLRNVRERLAGHFGDAASVALFRDEARGRTVARVELPAAAGERPGARPGKRPGKRPGATA